jgi:hypothetical protein
VVASQITLVPSEARTASGNTTAIEVPTGATIRFIAAVTAASGGAPSLTIDVQGLTREGTWFNLARLGPFTSTGDATAVVERVPGVIRVAWTISGTAPSFTFEVNAVG